MVMISCSGKIRERGRAPKVEESPKRGRPRGSRTRAPKPPRRDMVTGLKSERYPQVPVELSNRIQSATKGFLGELFRLLETLYESGIEGSLLELVETGYPALLAALGQELIAAHLEQERGYIGPRLKDNEGSIYDYQGERETTVLTPLGDVRFRRSYYTGPAGSGKTIFPLDHLLGITEHAVLPSVQENVGLLCSRLSYPCATDTLNRLQPLNMSLKRVENIAETIAGVVQKEQETRIKRAFSPGAVLPTVPVEQISVLEIDGGMCPVRDDEESHREFKLAALGRLDGKDVKDKHYIGHFGKPANLFDHLVTDFFELGHAGASHLHVVADGAKWIWNGVDALVQEKQRVTVVLDYYHVSERLTELTRALYPDNEADEQKAVLLDYLFEGKLDDFPTLEDWSQEPPPDATKTVKENLTYFTNNKNRLDYKGCREAGLPIGSGVIEGGVRFIGKDRLDGTGMRWLVPGAERILQLRCLDASQKWDRFWVKRGARNVNKVTSKTRGSGSLRPEPKSILPTKKRSTRWYVCPSRSCLKRVQ